jgi:hypothetical protein
VFLDASGSNDNDEYEKYLKRWENSQANDYNKCNKEFNEKTCRIRRARNNRDLSVAEKSEVDEEFSFEGFIESVTEEEDSGEDDLYYYSEDEDGDESKSFWNMAQRFLQNKNQKNKRLNRNKSKDPNRMRPYQLPKLTGSDFYYGYDGSLTVPPCSERVWYRIMRQPLKISKDQLRRTNDAIARHLSEDCELGTVGRELGGDQCHVDVARPLQFTHIVHHVTDCVEWHIDDTRKM